jgi:Ca2+-binding RTX toxin-like protein
VSRLAEGQRTEIISAGQLVGSGGVAIRGSAGHEIIRNYGTVTGDVRLGMGRDSFVNSADGVVHGDVSGAEGTQEIGNEGTIGAVSLGGGTDYVENLGTLGAVGLGAGADTYLGQDLGRRTGVAQLVSGGLGDDTLDGANASDTFDGGSNTDSLRGDDGDDALAGGSEGDLVFGDRGNDSVDGDAGADEVGGGAGDDFVIGGEGSDSLFGNLGNDTLLGGTGDDALVGGEGSDHFRQLPGDGMDVVGGFKPGTDVLDFAGYGFADADEALAFATEEGGNVVFAFAGGEVLTVANVTVAAIAGDIIT